MHILFGVKVRWKERKYRGNEEGKDMAPIKRAIIIVSCHILTARVSTQQTRLYKIQSPSPRYNTFAFGCFPQTSTPQKRIN